MSHIKIHIKMKHINMKPYRTRKIIFLTTLMIHLVEKHHIVISGSFLYKAVVYILFTGRPFSLVLKVLIVFAL